LYISRRLDEISLRLIEGQYLDISYEDRYDVTVRDYLAMIGGKTAALISGSMETGALVATEDDTVVAHLKEAGYYVGLAFQIRDDVLGVWGDRNETGKPAGNDILRRKKSFPIVSALEQADSATRDELVWIYGRESIDDGSLAQVLAIFDRLDVRIHAQEKIQHYSDQATQALAGIPLSETSGLEIGQLIQFLAERGH
jgi:geranylgeranyl diphosphate synthase type I